MKEQVLTKCLSGKNKVLLRDGSIAFFDRLILNKFEKITSASILDYLQIYFKLLITF